MTDATKPSDAETDLYIAMNRAIRTIHTAVRDELKARDLPPLPWYDVLWSIERRGGALRPIDLARDVIFEQSNISHLSRRLEREGLIVVDRCEDDRRGKLLRITDEGRRLRARMWAHYGPLLRRHLKPLAEEKSVRGLIAAIDRLAAR